MMFLNFRKVSQTVWKVIQRFNKNFKWQVQITKSNNSNYKSACAVSAIGGEGRKILCRAQVIICFWSL
jgi:putative lipoic acid-binding regulatory protein